MRTIKINDNLYEYIASKTKVIGEPAEDILRRLLDVPTKPTQKLAGEQHELADTLENPSLKFKSAVDKFLYILSAAHKLKPETFNKILKIQGRERKYFATSKSEIESSGNSTQPKQIPETTYWSMTNSPTQQKATMLRQVLEETGFSKQAALAASRIIN